MRCTRTGAATALCAAALVAAGCGGGDDDSGLGKAELAKKADAICVKYNALLKAVPTPKKKSDAAAYFAKELPLLKNAGDELRALKPSPSVKATWDGLVKDYDALVALNVRGADLLKAKKQKEYDALTGRMSELNLASNRKLDAFGAPHCGSKAGE